MVITNNIIKNRGRWKGNLHLALRGRRGKRGSARAEVDASNSGRQVDRAIVDVVVRATIDAEDAAIDTANEALRVNRLREQNLNLAEETRGARASASNGLRDRGGILSKDGLAHVTEDDLRAGQSRQASKHIGNEAVGAGIRRGRSNEAWRVVANVVGRGRNKDVGRSSNGRSGGSRDSAKSTIVLLSSGNLTKETSNRRHFLYSELRKKTRRGG